MPASMPQMVDARREGLATGRTLASRNASEGQPGDRRCFSVRRPLDLAKPWYAAVRDHALAEGDDSMISAMLHNSATFRANNVRLAEAFGNSQAAQAAQALMEADSTSNFDIGIRTKSLTAVCPVDASAIAQTFKGGTQKHWRCSIAIWSRADEQGMERMKPTSAREQGAMSTAARPSGHGADRTCQRRLASDTTDCDPDDLATMHALASKDVHGTWTSRRSPSSIRSWPRSTCSPMRSCKLIFWNRMRQRLAGNLPEASGMPANC